jgi:Ca2+/Na+ antiporter
VLLSISALVGSALFISSIVTALSTQAAKPSKRIQVTPVFYIRDLIFEIICMVYLLGVMLVIKEINIYIAAGFLLIYAVYVVLVVAQSKQLP